MRTNVLFISGQLALRCLVLYDTYVYMTEQLHSRRIRILIADNHRVVREQLAARLSRENDLEVVGMASSSRETWQEVQMQHPHMLLIDPLMRDGLGLATVRQLRGEFPKIVIVILTSYVDTALNMQFQGMGIHHILTKGIASSKLLEELRGAWALNRPGD